jgi:hypothetical protein
VTKPYLKVEGAKGVGRALRAVAGGIDDLKAVHAEAAEIVEVRARQIVPRLTGTLESSIRSSGQAGSGVVRAGRATVPYAGPIHFGWPAHHIAPRPFLYDALDERTDEVVEVYEDRVRHLIKQHGLD